MFKLLPALKAGGWLTPRLLIGQVREDSQNGALQAFASHLGKSSSVLVQELAQKSVFRFVRVGAIRTFQKKDDWCNVGFEKFRSIWWRKLARKCANLFHHGENVERFPSRKAKMSRNCFLRCTEILNSHENLPFYAFW